MFNAAQDQLADAALQNGTDIDVVAKKSGLTVKEISGFSRQSGGGGLGAAPNVIQAAFSQDVLDGRLSPITEIEKGRGVVLRGSNHKLPQQKPLSAVLAEVTEAWKKQRAVELAAGAAQDALKHLNAADQTLDAIAKSAGATAQAPKFVGRQDQTVPMEIRKAAFVAPKPGGKPSFQIVTLANGDSAALAVSAVRTDPGPDSMAGQFKRQYADEVAGTEAMAYANAARAQAKVSLNPQAID
jgi:peptidyl-prolyl cis-trans isomerase D